MNDRIIAVFGGTGFLGRRVVRQLREHGFSIRIVSRNPLRSRFGRDDPRLHSSKADIRDDRSVAEAVAGAYGVVNAVSLYVEHGEDTFDAVHVDAAQRLASQARRAGVERFVHISGIGADPVSPSRYIRKRGEGELAVRAAFPDATLVRPAVMFGPDDGFLTRIVDLLGRLPIYPMFGSGHTRLQPAFVDDAAAAVVAVIERGDSSAKVFECAGPRAYTYEEFVRAVAREAGLDARLVPVPFSLWYAMAAMAEMLPQPPLARNQVELMEIDSVASPDLPGFAELGIAPHGVEQVLRDMLRTH
jgi:NADH dehydrogenase